MILSNATTRLEEAIEKSNKDKQPQEVNFIYNELLNGDTILSVFEWLFKKSVDFKTEHKNFRFVITIYPQKLENNG